MYTAEYLGQALKKIKGGGGRERHITMYIMHTTYYLVYTSLILRQPLYTMTRPLKCTRVATDYQDGFGSLQKYFEGKDD